MSEAKTKESVRDFYGRVAKGQTPCCACSGKRTAREQSLLIGYTPEQLAQVPPEAVLGLGTPDKVRSFWEAHRVLRPEGRLVVSDLVTLGPLPEDLRRDARVWAECIGGALERHAYLAAIGEAGFREVSVLRQAPYDIPELDGRLSGKVATVTVRAVK